MSIYEYDEKKQKEFDIEEGVCKDRITLIQKKIAKGKSLEVIADELESTVDEVNPLYDIVAGFPTDMDPIQIMMRSHISI